MKIEFVRGGLSIPGVGLAEVGRTIKVDAETGKDLIEQGIAKKTGEVEKEKDDLKDLTRDELVALAVGFGIDPPNDANKKELREIITEKREGK